MIDLWKSLRNSSPTAWSRSLAATSAFASLASARRMRQGDSSPKSLPSRSCRNRCSGLRDLVCFSSSDISHTDSRS